MRKLDIVFIAYCSDFIFGKCVFRHLIPTEKAPEHNFTGWYCFELSIRTAVFIHTCMTYVAAQQRLFLSIVCPLHLQNNGHTLLLLSLSFKLFYSDSISRKRPNWLIFSYLTSDKSHMPTACMHSYLNSGSTENKTKTCVKHSTAFLECFIWKEMALSAAHTNRSQWGKDHLEMISLFKWWIR